MNEFLTAIVLRGWIWSTYVESLHDAGARVVPLLPQAWPLQPPKILVVLMALRCIFIVD